MSKNKECIKSKTRIFPLSVILKDCDLAIENTQAFVLVAAEAQKRMAGMMTQLTKNYYASLSLALPSIKAMLRTQEQLRKSLEPTYGMIAGAARIAAELQNSLLIRQMSEAQKIFAEFNMSFGELSKALHPQIEVMRAIKTRAIPIIDLESIASSARLNFERKERALDKIFMDSVEEISKLKRESVEKDKLIEELLVIIRNLQDRDKYFYVT